MTSQDAGIQFSALSPSILEREKRERVGRQILAVVRDHVRRRDLAHLRVLDVGCSSGIITTMLAGAAAHVVGVDVDREAIRIAQKEATGTNVEFLLMSGSTLDFPDGSFDLVVCNQVYYWLEDPQALMDEILRVLKPGGSCFFANVNKYKLWENQYRLPLLSVMPKAMADRMVRAAGKGDRFGCRYLSVWELQQLCRKFVIHRYTARVLKNPVKYQFVNLAKLAPVTGRLPLWLLETFEPISPNLIWVLDKNAETTVDPASL
jgi:2-polyprenyl-3-methyl-5-hydroxy-6-metoxy-1,4-benzoquinol methylase